MRRPPPVRPKKRIACGISGVGKTGDPYRWLEGDTPAVRRWVERQNSLAAGLLNRIDGREVLRARFAHLLRGRGCAVPLYHRGRRFHKAIPSGGEVPALYVTEPGAASAQILIDPVAVTGSCRAIFGALLPSPNGRWLLTEISDAGSTTMALYLFDAQTGDVVDHRIPASHFPRAAAWREDSRGFYYVRHPSPGVAGEERYHQRLLFHELHRPFDRDVVIFGEGLPRETQLDAKLSADGRYLIIVSLLPASLSERSCLYIQDRRRADGRFSSVLTDVPGRIEVRLKKDMMIVEGAVAGADRGIFKTPLAEAATGQASWQAVVVPPPTTPIGRWIVVAGFVLVELIDKASSRLWAYPYRAGEPWEVPIPGGGAIESLNSDETGTAALVGFSGCFLPPRLYLVDPSARQCFVRVKSGLDIAAEAFEDHLEWCESADGTPVSMLLMHRRGLALNGGNPVVMHGYGGFNVRLAPRFRPEIVPFLERGGVYAIVHARGGGEYGRDWHEAAIGENRARAFDDFIAAAEWLVDRRYTSPDRLACYGWSAGGLLVNAVAIRRPDLWRAVVSGAPVTDLIRFHHEHFARRWMSDLGSPEVPEQLDWLRRLSPCHGLKGPLRAPSVLIFLPGSDERVAKWHGYRMLAAWQEATTSSAPILLREQADLPHRGGEHIGDLTDRLVDIWSYLFWQLGLEAVMPTGH